MENNRKFRVHAMQKKAGSSVYRNSRTIFWRETFTEGRYVLVACTFEPSLEGEFLLRCYAGHNIRMRYELSVLGVNSGWLGGVVVRASDL